MLAVAVSLFILSCICLIVPTKSTVKADEIRVPTPSDQIIDVSTGFEMDQSVSVRISGKAMLFTAVVTEEFNQSLCDKGGVSYFAVIGAKDGIELALEYGEKPTFNKGGEYKLRAYLNFDGASDKVLELALNTEFYCCSYAKVVSGDKTEYYKAANSGLVSGIMPVVTLDSYLNYKEGVGYERDDLLALGTFSILNDYKSVTGTVIDGETLSFFMPDFTSAIDGERYTAFIGSKPYTVQYNAVSGNFIGAISHADFGQDDSFYVSVFKETGKAYVTKVFKDQSSVKFKLIFDLEGQVKIKYSVLTPQPSWEVTDLGGEMYSVRIVGKLPSGVQSEKVIDSFEGETMPTLTILSPITQTGKLPEFAFGGKWRYFVGENHYFEIRVDNGKIAEYKNGNLIRNLSTAEFESEFVSSKVVDGCYQIELNPYFRRDWS